MSFHSWLQNLRSALAPGRGQRHHGRRGSLRAATHRPNLEVLEDRLMPSFSPAASFPVGTNPAGRGRRPTSTTTASSTWPRRTPAATPSACCSATARAASAPPADFAAGTGPALRSRSATSTTTASSTWRRPTATTTGYGGRERPAGQRRRHLPDARQHLSSAGWPLSVAAADFNADGNMRPRGTPAEYDLTTSGVRRGAAGRRPGRLRVPRHTRTSNSREHQSALAVADLNGDGKLDVVARRATTASSACCWATATARCVHGYSDFSDHGHRPRRWRSATSPATASPTWSSPARRWTSCRGHGDGTFDAADPPFRQRQRAHGRGGGRLQRRRQARRGDVRRGHRHRQRAAGQRRRHPDATPTRTPSARRPSAVAVGDFNGDGRPDVAAANAGSNTVSVLLNDGDWTPPPPPAAVAADQRRDRHRRQHRHALPPPSP